MGGLLAVTGGRGSLVVMITDSWVAAVAEWSRYRIVDSLVTRSSPAPLMTRSCRGAMQVTSVESSNVLPLLWCGMPRDWAHSGQSFPWFSKTHRLLGHGNIFVNVCGDDVLCSSEGQGGFRLSRLRSLLGFLVGSFIAWDPNRAWDPLTRTRDSTTPAANPCGVTEDIGPPAKSGFGPQARSYKGLQNVLGVPQALGSVESCPTS
ncbi:hypothetical protein TNCV_4478361 [Trichonephila clavipes]|nr:hypothetical protein TNCV_4478361 [Trichonephila clavipes]